MRIPSCLALLSALLLPLAAAPPPGAAAVPSAWQLVWSSEFNGPAGAPPAATQWTYDGGNRRGWGNNELENYCAPDDHAAPCSPRPNIFQDGHGHLVIQARRDAAGHWTSGRMKTQGLYQTSYGRIEARMKLPLGAGLWPAFWMLGTGPGGWPAEGEIDIMEHVPQLGSGTIQSTIHAADFFGGHGLHDQATLPTGATVASGFHTYGVIWSPGRMQFYLDHPAHPFVTLTPPTPQSSWPFDDSADPFQILLNLAVGGNWPGPPSAATPATANLLVDYVRVYNMAKLERLLFDLIETVSVDEHHEDFARALTEQIVRVLAKPLRIGAAATLRLNRARYEPEFTMGAAPLRLALDGQLSARTVQRRLDGQLWLIQRGIHNANAVADAAADVPAAAPAWFDLILIPIDRSLDTLLALMTDSLAGEEGQKREAAFQDMAQLLRLFVDRHHQRERLQEILTLADQQQLSLLPPELPHIPGYDLAASCVPAEEVGGDYYQAYPLSYTAGGFALADAKGKGFEAAMQVTGLHAALRTVNELPFKLTHKVGLLNRSMIQSGELRNLISLFLAEWDSEGRLLYVNCSHPPPFWMRADGSVTELGEGGRFLGLDAKSTYRFGIAELQPGDTIVAFTDGWTELFNEEGEEFGPQRLRAVLEQHRGAPLEAIMAALQTAADDFRGDLPFDDDRTLFLLRKQ